MKGTVLLAAAVLLAAGTSASAQDPAAPAAKPQTPPPASAPHATPAPTSVDPHDIRTMELVLTNAVRTGAETLSRQMMAREPGSMFLVETARARGFVLEGYGVFFAVDVPMMRQSAVWSARQLMMQDLRNKIRTLQQIAANARDPDTREQARVQAQALAVQLQEPAGSVGSADAVAVPATNPSRNAQPVASGAPQPPPGTVGAAVAPDSAVAPIVSALADANEAYTEAVKTALIDAMLKHSFSLRLADEEWLTVAARDAEGPAIPGQIDNASTIVIRIKGSDLTAYVTNKLTREEVLKKVQVREF